MMVGIAAAFVTTARQGGLRSLKTGEPVMLVVSVTIKEDRLEDFLKAIEVNAKGSRENENGGCYRFDVVQEAGSNNRFVFYEAYRDEEAVAFHKASPHFGAWKDFKATGGVLEQSVIKGKGIFYGSRNP